MKRAIKVAIAWPLSITTVEDIVSTKEEIRVTGVFGASDKPVDPTEYYVALTDGNKVICELPSSEDTCVDLLNKLLEHYGMSREGKRNKWD